MKFRIFISSVQREFAKEPQVANYRDDIASQASPKHHDDALVLRLVDAFGKAPFLGQYELRRFLGVSRATVQRCFKRLLEAGKVAHIGGSRFGHWEVIV